MLLLEFVLLYDFIRLSVHMYASAVARGILTLHVRAYLM